MNKNINNNGYDYVDLGLPSGTLWATCNVGASKPSDYGQYFQWGDTQGYTSNQVGTGEGQKKFAKDWSDYKWGVNPNYSKYTTTGATLDLEDDAAHVNMGGSWHMPTPTQIQELINTANTTSTGTIQDGVNGRLFTSTKDTSKSIFFPAAGVAWNGSVQDSGDYGDVWSSMLNADGVDYGQGLDFTSGNVVLIDYDRCDGLSVRGVIDQKIDSFNGGKSNKEMNNDLNVAEILKGIPKGTKLWSPVYGECTLLEVNENWNTVSQLEYPISCEDNKGKCRSFTKEGKFFNDNNDTECILFPSKENRDWSTFKVSNEHKHFESYQKVLIKDKFCSKYFWVAALYSHYDTLTNKHYLVGSDWAGDEDIIPYEGNEDKVGKIIE